MTDEQKIQIINEYLTQERIDADWREMIAEYRMMLREKIEEKNRHHISKSIVLMKGGDD